MQQYTGILESKAVDLIIQDGFEPKVRRVPNGDQPVGIVFDQSPTEGTSLAKGGIVTILVSTGKKKVTVPNVVGKQLTDAVATLTRAGLNAKSVGVPSDKPSGTVTAQDPGSGTSVVEGASVRINYSTGPKQVAVPPVVGLDYSTALQQLQAAGFAVARTDVESNQPAGIVVSQVPSGSSTATKGSTVNLSVSNGPQTSPLPDVTGQTEADAKATLKAAGFKVAITRQDTDVETFDGVVISQDPPGNTQQDPNTIVTLFVGKYVAPATTDTTDTTDHDDHHPAEHTVTARLRVAVLAGGRSSEHEISLASARSVVEALDPARYDAQTIEIGRDGAWALPPAAGSAALGSGAAGLPIPTRAAPAALGAIDVVLPILHGPFGEDGTVQGLLELAGVPTSAPASRHRRSAWTRTSSRPSSATAASRSPRTSRSGPATRSRTRSAIRSSSSRPGSARRSGSRRSRAESELEDAVALARRHDDKVLVEEFQPGMEVEVGVLGNRAPIASVVGEIVAHADWYDFEAKYADGGMELIVPARLPGEVLEEVQRLAVESFVATDCEGMARVDFFVRPDGAVVVNELNTIPGFTATSVYAKLFAESGIPYPELLDRLVALALERHELRRGLEY